MKTTIERNPTMNVASKYVICKHIELQIFSNFIVI